MTKGNLEESQRLLNIAMERFPQSTRIRLSLAELQELRGGRTKESVQIIREIFRDGIDIAAAIGDAGFVQVGSTSDNLTVFHLSSLLSWLVVLGDV